MFVQVKENAYLDLDRGISIEIEPVNNEFVLSIDHVRTVYTTSYQFPTLEEAIAAQKRIIESCNTTFTYDPGHYKPLAGWLDKVKLEG